MGETNESSATQLDHIPVILGTSISKTPPHVVALRLQPLLQPARDWKVGRNFLHRDGRGHSWPFRWNEADIAAFSDADRDTVSG